MDDPVCVNWILFFVSFPLLYSRLNVHAKSQSALICDDTADGSTYLASRSMRYPGVLGLGRRGGPMTKPAAWAQSLCQQ